MNKNKNIKSNIVLKNLEKINFNFRSLLIFSFLIFNFSFSNAQPKTDCVCNGSTSGKGKFFVGLGGDFHLGKFENDDRKYAVSTLGFQFHAGYNFNMKWSIQLNAQKYAFAGLDQPEKSYNSIRYSYLDFSLVGTHRFMKRGSRFIPYVQVGYTLNNTLKREFTGTNSQLTETGFAIQGHYINLGAGSLFVLANQFTIFAEIGTLIHPATAFNGTYISDVFKLKPGISVGVNYHF